MTRPASADVHQDCGSVVAKKLGQETDLGDLRFRSLLSTEDWQGLPLAVRHRFSKRLSSGKVALYTGKIAETRFSRLGWLLAQTLRLVGSPLPLSRDTGTTAVVSVGEDPLDGQLWTRFYHRASGFPQMINSAKRFAGHTGLEEHIGYGIGMALRVTADSNGLEFTSDHYFWQISGLRLKLPCWITPGNTTVSHIEQGHGKFDFVLQIKHPVFGLLLHQRVEFVDQ